MLSLPDFVTQYAGQPNVGDTPENKGECVGLIEVYLNSLNLPHIWGNAKDLLQNADKSVYIVIFNTPSNAPAPGDILVWGDTWGNGFGHTAIVLNADVNIVTVFEQNNPIGSPPRTTTHDYKGVLGWIHPKTLPNTTTQSMTDGQIQDQLNAEVQALTQCQTQLKTAVDQNVNLQQQVTQLQNEKNDLQSKYNDLQSTVAHLNTQIASIKTEDANYATQAADASKLADNRLGYMKDIAGVTNNDTTLTDEPLRNAILDEVMRLQDEEKKLQDMEKTTGQSPVKIVMQSPVSQPPQGLAVTKVSVDSPVLQALKWGVSRIFVVK